MGPSVLTVALGLAALPPLGLAVALSRRPPAPGKTPYAGLLLLIGLHALLEAGATLAGVPVAHRIIEGGVVSLRILAAGVFVFFALEYTGRDLRTARRVLLVAAGAAVITTGLLLADPSTELLWLDYQLEVRGAAIVADVGYGPWLGLMGLLAASALASGLWLLGEESADDAGLHSRQLALLSLIAVVPTVGIARRAVNLGPFPYVDVAAFVTAGIVPVIWIGYRHGELFESTPAARRLGGADVIEDLGLAVLVLDDTDRVADLNGRAQSLFGNGTGNLIGQSLPAQLGNAIPDEAGESIVRLRTPAGRRSFKANVSPLKDDRGTTIGRTLVLSDVTEQRHRRQRFEVLNRVFRHNVRNAMNAVVGFAGQLEAAVDEEARWMVERIRRQAADVIELGDRAGRIERITAPDANPEQVRIVTVLDPVATTLQADDAGAVAVDAPADLTVTTIRPVLEEAVTAAIESLRSAGDKPAVRLDAAPSSSGWVSVLIESDGPPIPPTEQSVIEAGEETALSHCRDIDLWLVAWSIETLGGELEFGTAPSRIELRLPHLPG